MIVKTASYVTQILIDSGVIEEENCEVYHFGLEMAFAMFLNLITTIMIGLLFRMLLESIVFLLLFIPLRSYAGGFHASNHFKCYWLSQFSVIAVLCLVQHFKYFVISPFGISVAATCVVIIFSCSPIPDLNRLYDEIEIYVFRKRARIVLLIELVVTAIFHLLEIRTYLAITICVYILVGCVILIGILKNCIKNR